MPTLLLRLAGPMQSWGTRSRFDDRDTERIPSKSGVVGLLCAALGRSRGESLEDLRDLRMAVRADQPGILQTDYHTALNVAKASGGTKDCQPSRRHYLADAQFLVGLEGPGELLRCLQQAVRQPRWPMFLGRKSFPPGLPVALADDWRDTGLREAMATYPWLPLLEEAQAPEWVRQKKPSTVEVEWELRPMEVGGSETRQDQPVSFAHADRNHSLRQVCRERIHLTAAASSVETVDLPDFFTSLDDDVDSGSTFLEDGEDVPESD